jgi:hypothetical protein
MRNAEKRVYEGLHVDHTSGAATGVEEQGQRERETERGWLAFSRRRSFVMYAASRLVDTLGAPAKYLMQQTYTRKVDVRLPGKGNPTSHGARPVY